MQLTSEELLTWLHWCINLRCPLPLVPFLTLGYSKLGVPEITVSIAKYIQT